jgi:hypothetical protein
MRSSRQRLTLLKKRITEHLPDDDDVFGYHGISKNILVDAIDDSYRMLELLDEHSGKYELIFLERKISELFEKSTKLIKDNFGEKHEEFDEFLTIVHKISLHIKQAYILVVKEPIRTDIQLDEAKRTIIELETHIDTLKPLYDELLAIKQNSESFIEELEVKHSTAIENDTLIKVNVEKINAFKTEAEKAAQQIPVWAENIKTLKEEYATKGVEYAELNKKIDLLKTENENGSVKIAALTLQLEDQLKNNDAFQTIIKNTIGNASRTGLAGSFKARKDELSKSLLIWGSLTIVSISVLILLSYNTLIGIEAKAIDMTHIVARFPVFAACVWLGWFCAKQYGFTSRVMEDYAYKYASSMAFEGYNAKSNDIDEKLQHELLSMTISNISMSPLHIFESKNNHAHPVESFSWFKRRKRIAGKIGENEIEVDLNGDESN